MSRLLSNRTLFILLASFILLIAVAGLTLRNQGEVSTLPERLVMDVQNTIGAWIYRPVSQVTNFVGGIHDLHDMYVENAQLKSEMQNYAALNARLRDAEATNARLSKMVGFKQKVASKYALIPANVIGRDPSNWNSEITIDIGRAEGIHDNMAVISIDGSLVGRVTVAAQYSSKVVLVTDTQVGDGVSARVQTAGVDQPFGIVMGSNTANGQLEMDFLSPLANVARGNTVVTSGLSDVFPPGLLIGTVKSVKTGLQGLTQTAVVTPAADLDYLQNVFVVTASGGKP